MGKDSRVTALVTGISNIKPPQPKYCTIWDVEDVLNQLRTWPHNELLSPEQLTFKLVMLVALIAINRGSEIHKLDIHKLDIKFMGITKTKAVFSFGSAVKHSRRGRITPPIEFHARPQEPGLCPVLTLHCYLEMSKKWRNEIVTKQSQNPP